MGKPGTIADIPPPTGPAASLDDRQRLAVLQDLRIAYGRLRGWFEAIATALPSTLATYHKVIADLEGTYTLSALEPEASIADTWMLAGAAETSAGTATAPEAPLSEPAASTQMSAAKRELRRKGAIVRGMSRKDQYDLVLQHLGKPLGAKGFSIGNFDKYVKDDWGPLPLRLVKKPK